MTRTVPMRTVDPVSLGFAAAIVVAGLTRRGSFRISKVNRILDCPDRP